MPAETIDMRYMIHRIHAGEEANAATGHSYTVYGFGSNAINFDHVRYPAPRGACDMCHINGTQNPPLDRSHASINSPRQYLNPMGPTAAACLSCHTSIDAASHSLVNTSQLGESCGACHSASAEFNVGKSHAPEVR
jgi:OmcA/MtrC family decaheme c-type cytochrome